MLNPDVSPREMGIMEKCTFCIQKLRAFKDQKRDKYGFIGAQKIQPDDAELLNTTAVCASACPTNSIMFGNLLDSDSALAKSFDEPRSYRMLEELNNKPGVNYLARIVHTGSKLHHGGHGDHGDDHGSKDHGHDAHH